MIRSQVSENHFTKGEILIRFFNPLHQRNQLPIEFGTILNSGLSSIGFCSQFAIVYNVVCIFAILIKKVD